MTAKLPDCGLYRTTKPIGGIEAGRLVYFHNHGDPGPGVYQPEGWNGNRARFSPNGTTIPSGFDYASLKALPAEGFYRVNKAFHCCEKQCMKFEPDAFVQLGYNGKGQALVFIPELGGSSISIPERGTFVDEGALKNMTLLKLAEKKDTGGGGVDIDIKLPRGIIVH